VPLKPWDDLSRDFIMALPRTQEGVDTTMVVAHRFSKMAHFAICQTDDESYTVEIYLKEIFGLYGVPKTIVSH